MKKSTKPWRRSIIIAYAMLFTFGFLGIHRWYLGRTTSAWLYLFTFGLLGFGIMVDILAVPYMARHPPPPQFWERYKRIWGMD